MLGIGLHEITEVVSKLSAQSSQTVSEETLCFPRMGFVPLQSSSYLPTLEPRAHNAFTEKDEHGKRKLDLADHCWTSLKDLASRYFLAFYLDF